MSVFQWLILIPATLTYGDQMIAQIVINSISDLAESQCQEIHWCGGQLVALLTMRKETSLSILQQQKLLLLLYKNKK